MTRSQSTTCTSRQHETARQLNGVHMKTQTFTSSKFFCTVVLNMSKILTTDALLQWLNRKQRSRVHSGFNNLWLQRLSFAFQISHGQNFTCLLRSPKPFDQKPHRQTKCTMAAPVAVALLSMIVTARKQLGTGCKLCRQGPEQNSRRT